MSLTITKELPEQERHRRKCGVCRHKHLAEIDEAYLQWEPIAEIVAQFGIEERALFRHVKALGLDDKRRENRKKFYLKIMERANLSEVTVSEAIQAGKLLEMVEGTMKTTAVVEQRIITSEEKQQRLDRIKELVGDWHRPKVPFSSST